ncbi:putative phage related protein [Escherichia coli]|nr:putative phage related protein [Escherichia coli]
MEFEIKGVKYRTAKLSVFDQLKVTRKLLPVLARNDVRFREYSLPFAC